MVFEIGRGDLEITFDLHEFHSAEREISGERVEMVALAEARVEFGRQESDGRADAVDSESTEIPVSLLQQHSNATCRSAHLVPDRIRWVPEVRRLRVDELWSIDAPEDDHLNREKHRDTIAGRKAVNRTRNTVQERHHPHLGSMFT